MKNILGSFTSFLLAAMIPASALGAQVDKGCSPTVANPCTGGSGGGGSSGGGNSAAAAQFGQAIGAGIVNMYKQAAAEKAEAARLAAIQAAEQQERQRIEEEARKERLLSGMQGMEAGGTLGLMLGDEPVADSIAAVFSRARERHGSEGALRRAALERMAGKPDADWCKLHLPQALVMPLRSSGDDRSYPSKIKKFAADRTEWDKRCDGPSASGPTSLDADLALLQREPKAPPAAKAPAVAAAPAPEPAIPALQAGGLALMTDDAPPRAAPPKEPAPAPAPAPIADAVPAKAPEPAAPSLQAGGLELMSDDAPPAAPKKAAPIGEPQPKGWTAAEAEPKAIHAVEGGTPGMPPPAPAPVFPSAPPAREASVALSAAPASPGAFAFMRAASAPAPRERAQKPKYALPMLTKVLSVEEGVAFTAASVRVLYNLGAAPSEAVETKTVLIYEKDEADKLSFEAENGIAILPAGSVEWKDLTAESAGPNRWLPAEASVGAKR